MTKMQDYMVEAKDMIECADSGDFISRLPEHVARLLAENNTDCANIAD
jgi:hypothetical protein